MQRIRRIASTKVILFFDSANNPASDSFRKERAQLGQELEVGGEPALAPIIILRADEIVCTGTDKYLSLLHARTWSSNRPVSKSGAVSLSLLESGSLHNEY